MNKKSNLYILLLLGLIWSSFAIFTSIASNSLSPFFISFARLFIGGAMLSCYCLTRKIKIFSKKDNFRYLIVGLFNSALPFTLFAFAARHLDSGMLAILDGTIPTIETFISFFILKRHVDRNSIIGVILGFVGAVMVAFAGHGGGFEWTYLFASIIVLLATTSYAGISIYIHEKCKDINAARLSAGSVWMAAALLSPSLLFTNIFTINNQALFSVMGLGVLCTGLAYVLYFRLAAEETPRIATSVVLLIPFFGTIFGLIFLGETLTIGKIFGCILILISMGFIINPKSNNA